MPDNNSPTTLQFVLSFAGGGVISAIITAIVTYIRTNNSEKTERRIKRLQEQLENFYGPLYYLVSINERLFDINGRYFKAYDEIYTNVKYSDNELTQQRLEENLFKTIDTANQYIYEVVRNNEKIIELLDKGYSYVDSDDVELLVQFYEDYIRNKTERDEEKKVIKPPIRVYNHVGKISFMRPELINKIKVKSQDKIDELNQLLTK